MKIKFVVLFLLGFSLFLAAASPPQLIHYQGVLRDANGVPEDGSFDMIFVFYSVSTDGTIMLRDFHQSGGSGAVQVTGGLFSVDIGSGTASAGTEPDLATMFANNDTVWLEIIVSGEVMTPRTRVVSAAQALNADHLDGLDSTDLALSGHDHNSTYYTQTLLNSGQLDSRYFAESEHIFSSAGAGDAFKPITLNGSGEVDSSMLPNGGSFIAKNSPDITVASSETSVLSIYNTSVTGGSALYGGSLNSESPNGTYTGLAGNSGVDGDAGTTALLTNYGLTGTAHGNPGESNDLNENYGVLGTAYGTNVSGATLKAFGVKGKATSNGENYGIYGEASGGTTNWAGFFLGDTSTVGNATVAGNLNLTQGSGRVNFSGITSSYLMTFANNTSTGLYWDNGNDALRFRYLGFDVFALDLDNQFAQIYGDLLVNDHTTLGQTSGDRVTFNALVNSNFLPSTSGLDLGSSSLRWDLYAQNIDSAGSGIFGEDLSIGTNSTADDDYIYFDNYGSNIHWDEANSRFVMSHTLISSGDLITFGTVYGSVFMDSNSPSYFLDPNNTGIAGRLNGDFSIGYGSATDNDVLYFDQDAEYLRWDNTNARFNVSDDFSADGNVIGTRFSDSGDLNYWVEPAASGNISARLARNVLIGYASGTDDDYLIFDAGINYLGWIEASDHFVLSNDLKLGGTTITGADNTTLTDDTFSLKLVSDTGMAFMMDSNNNSGNFDSFEYFHNGLIAPGTETGQLAELEASGDWEIRGLLSTGVTNFDVAEMFVKGEAMEPGMLVSLDPNRKNGVILTTGSGDNNLLGVISASPGVILGGAMFDESMLAQWGEDLHQDYMKRQPGLAQAQLKKMPGLAQQLKGKDLLVEGKIESRQLNKATLRAYQKTVLAPVALAGRVSVKVDTSNGPIEAGDLLSPGPTPGIAVKAIHAGPIIGTAMESFSGERGEILTFIHRGHYTPAGPFNRDLLKEEILDEIRPILPNPQTGLQTMSGNLKLVLDGDGNQDGRFSLFSEKAGGPGQEIFRVDEQGNVFTKGSLRPQAMDLAEFHPVSEAVQGGDVLAVDLENPGYFKRAVLGEDPAVVGIVSSTPGIVLGSGLDRILEQNPALAARLEQAIAHRDQEREDQLWKQLEDLFQSGHAAMALSGTVPCKVDATYGTITPGDLLVASPTPGHAMRIDNPIPGTVIGKALDSLDRGTGTISVLVMNR